MATEYALPFAASFFERNPHPYFNTTQATANRPLPRGEPQPPELPALVEWVLFDRRITVIAEAFADGHLPTASSATTADEDGDVFRARLYLRDPPTLSLALLVESDEDLATALAAPGPLVLAADADRILIHIARLGAAKLLVYTADPDDPFLDALPPCYSGPSSLGRGTALLSRRDEYAVAFMETPVGRSADQAVQLTTYTSSSELWMIRRLAWPSSAYPSGWTPDAAVAHRDCVCFVDYSRAGILVCDVFSAQPVLLHLALPVPAPEAAQVIWHYKSVCVCDGLLKFLDVDRRSAPPRAGITVWSLDAQGYVWTKQSQIQVLDSVPQAPPRFPLHDGLDASSFYVTMARAGLKDVYRVNRTTAALQSKYPYADHNRMAMAGPYTPYVGSDIAQFVQNRPEIEEPPEEPAAGGAYTMAVAESSTRRIKSQKTD